MLFIAVLCSYNLIFAPFFSCTRALCISPNSSHGEQWLNVDYPDKISIATGTEFLHVFCPGFQLSSPPFSQLKKVVANLELNGRLKCYV